MDDYVVPQGTVDPEVRAYVYSLVSAIGGTGADDDGRYVLGDDALACLKDIKRWLKLFDEKTNSLDVARCLAESNLVKGDLLEILATWPEDATEDRLKSKIALASLELLVPLTWPLERSELLMNANYHRHVPYLQLKQISYKREVLEHPTSNILHTAIRVAIPSIGLSISERSQRDEGIIRLILYFLRNIVMIEAAPDLPVEWNESEVSRSPTIEAFQKQDVLALLLAMASNVGDDFKVQDVLVLEILFHLIKGVEINKLFLDEEALSAKASSDLRGLLGKEADMLRNNAKHAPSRHNRFGTMIWVKRDDERMSAVSGQDVLTDSKNALTKMDQTKKWNRPQRRNKEERLLNHFDLPTLLSKNAAKDLRSFVGDFLDAGFNPLFNHLRRAIEGEADRILDAHKQQFFYVIGWFLEAERARRKSQKSKRQEDTEVNQYASGDFGIVASVLNQETFVIINRSMEYYLEHKQWHELNAAMRCFTQILLTVQEMTESKQDVDQEIAENIQNRIFYEETTHDRIVTILRGYKDQGLSFLDACTELSHVFLRMLERYSKENIDLQIRSKRRTKKKQKDQQPIEDQADRDEQDSEAEELADAQRVSKERKFDFTRFSGKFLTQNCINSFVTFTTYYKDLTQEQLKRAHRFFHRVAFKQEMSVMLFRMDILELFHRMIRGSDHISSVSPVFPEWEELVKQLFRRLTKKLEARPELFVELLFSKIPSTAFFLEYGYEKQTISSKPRAPAELEVKGALTREEQLGVAVAVLHENKMDAINFVRATLEKVAAERQSWQDQAAARAIENGGTESERALPANPFTTVVRSENEEVRGAMFKDSKLRLLMKLAGFERNGENDDPDALWTVPSSLTAASLQETAALIERYQQDPILQYGDEGPIAAEEMLQRKSQPNTRRAAFDDDSGIDSDDFGEEDFLFPAGGPTARKATALEGLKKSRRKRKQQNRGELDDETLAAQQQARKLADLERRRKIKSDVFVHDSDDEEDDNRDADFFTTERELQKKHAAKVMGLMQTQSTKEMRDKKRKRKEKDEKSRKRARSDDDGLLNSTDERSMSNGDGESEDDEARVDGASSPSMQGMLGLGLGTSDNEDSDTPMSSPAGQDYLERSSLPVKLVGKAEVAWPDEDVDDDENIDSPVAVSKSGQRGIRAPSEAHSSRHHTSKEMVTEDLGDAEDEDADVPAGKARTGRDRQRMTLLDDSDDE